MCNFLPKLLVPEVSFSARAGTGKVVSGDRTVSLSREVVKGSGFKSSVVEAATSAVVDIACEDGAWRVTQIYEVDGLPPSGEVKPEKLARA